MPEVTKRTCRLVTRKDETFALFTSALVGCRLLDVKGLGTSLWWLGGCISVKRQSSCWSVIHMQVTVKVFSLEMQWLLGTWVTEHHSLTFNSRTMNTD